MLQESSRPGKSDANVVRESLARLIRHKMPDAQDIEVSAPVRTSMGLSRENWIFNAAWHEGGAKFDVPMILRRDPAGSLLETDRLHELTVLRALAQTALPVPRVRWADIEGAWLGSPSLLMDIVEGVCDWHVLNGDGDLSDRLRLARELLDMLVAIQQVDWSGLSLNDVLGHPGDMPAVFELNRWDSERKRVQREPIPELDLVHQWLRHRARAARRLALVHGDYKPGNVLLHNGKISAVLDWETAHIGDPLEDLGWITNPVRSGEHQIRQHWERAEIVAWYKAKSGYEFEESELVWWNIFSCWKLSIIVLTGISSGIDGLFDRIYNSPTWLYRKMFAMMDDAL